MGKKRLRAGEVCSISILTITLIMLIFPFYIMIITSLKSGTQFIQNFWGIEFPIHWENYSRAWRSISLYFWNSVKVTGLTVAGLLLVVIPAGYSFARFNFRGKNILFYLIIAFSMIPTTLILVPMFLNVLELGLNDNHWGIILPNIASLSIVAIMLTRSFFQQIPASLFESAHIDGAKESIILRKIVIPLSKPIIGTVAVINIFNVFNQYMWPFIVLSNNKLKTIPIGLATLAGQHGVNFGYQMAGYTLAALPLLIVFASTSKLYVSGITAGAIKG